MKHQIEIRENLKNLLVFKIKMKILKAAKKNKKKIILFRTWLNKYKMKKYDNDFTIFKL
jgi:hypothetical protein